MSSHTQDLLTDPKCSLTVASKQFKGAADGRVNLMGQVKLVPQEEREALKAKHRWCKISLIINQKETGKVNWL